MTFKLSTLLLLVTIVGLGVAWALDHHRLVDENKRLNAEAADYFSNWVSQSAPIRARDFPADGPSWGVYQVDSPKDRAAYLETFGHALPHSDIRQFGFSSANSWGSTRQ